MFGVPVQPRTAYAWIRSGVIPDLSRQPWTFKFQASRSLYRAGELIINRSLYSYLQNASRPFQKN